MRITKLIECINDEQKLRGIFASKSEFISGKIQKQTRLHEKFINKPMWAIDENTMQVIGVAIFESIKQDYMSGGGGYTWNMKDFTFMTEFRSPFSSPMDRVSHSFAPSIHLQEASFDKLSKWIKGGAMAGAVAGTAMGVPDLMSSGETEEGTTTKKPAVRQSAEKPTMSMAQRMQEPEEEKVEKPKQKKPQYYVISLKTAINLISKHETFGISDEKANKLSHWDVNGIAKGTLQIHKDYVTDANDFLGFDKYDWETDTHDPNKAKGIAEAYLTRYGRHYARKHKTDYVPLSVLYMIHNGGPNGYKKAQAKKHWGDMVRNLANDKLHRVFIKI